MFLRIPYRIIHDWKYFINQKSIIFNFHNFKHRQTLRWNSRTEFILFRQLQLQLTRRPPSLLSFRVWGFSLGFLGLFEKEVPPEEKILLYIKKAILAIEEEEYDVAEKNLNLAFYYSHKHGFSEALSQVTSYQANLAFKRGDLARAEKLFKFLSIRMINLKQGTATDNAFVEISLKLAEICARSGRPEEAMSGYQYCVVTQKRKIDSGAEDEDTLLLGAWSLHNLSQMYIQLASPGKKDDIHLAIAIKCLTEASSFVSKAVGQEAQQTVAIQSDLATALALQGNYDDAFKIFNDIGNIARETHMDMYPNIQISIATVHLQKSEFEEANKLCVEAKDFATKLKDTEAFQRAEDCIMKSLHRKEKLKA